MKKLCTLYAVCFLLSGVVWAKPANDAPMKDEVAQTIRACGKPLADRVDANPAAAGGKERLLRYKGIELSFQKVEGEWVFWGSSLPSGIANLDRAQTVRNLNCFHDVVGVKWVASPGPVMPKKAYVLSADPTAQRAVAPASAAEDSKAKPVRLVVIAVAVSLMVLSLLGWIVMSRNAKD